MWTPPLEYKLAHIAVTESLTSVDSDTETEIETETDEKTEQKFAKSDLETTVLGPSDSDTISINLADTSAASAADDSSTDTAVVDLGLTVEPTAAATAAADSDTVSVDLAELASATLTAPEIVVTDPPAAVTVPVAVPPVLLPLVDCDSESEMAESQSNTQFAPPPEI